MKAFFKKIWENLKTFFQFLWQNFRLSDTGKKRATWGLLIISSVIVLLLGVFMQFGVNPWIDPFIGILLVAIIFFLLGAGFLLVLKLLNLFTRFYKDWGIILFGGLVLVLTILLQPEFGLFLGLFLAIIESFFFSALFYLLTKDFKRSKWGKRSWILTGIVIGLFVNGYIIYFLQWNGQEDYLTDLEQVKQKELEPLQANNPAEKGTFEVNELTYGSGNFRNRPEFGKEATIKTQTVDGTEFLKDSKGLKMKIRKLLLGFDKEHLPLNGQVWYPEGEGPFPLVLTVHGNHGMTEFSDPGYEYLGKHLASNGYIMVSVDQNFLNGSIVGGLGNENDCRGWMLLQHLKLWHQWNRTDNSMFYQKIDTTRLALIGHSRGGEAAAIAGNFNRLPYYPDNAKVSFDFNFNIQSIIAIAPCDGQYSPAGKPNKIENINYFVIQGAHDADVTTFMGMKQYHRVKIEKDSLFKASLYVHRANHGQFNSVWGRTDYGWPLNLFLNKQPLLEGEDQRKIAKVYFTAFLDATIKNKREYIPMFKDYRKATPWLPEDIYINRYADNSFIPVCTFDEDVDVTTGTQAGVKTLGEFLKCWKEHDLSYRSSSSKKNNVLTLGWKRDTTEMNDTTSTLCETDSIPGYHIKIPGDFMKTAGLDSNSVLLFSAANTEEKVPDDEKTEEKTESTANANKDEANEKEEDSKKQADTEEKEKLKQVNFSIKLIDAKNETVKIALSEFAYIPPVLKAEFLKLKSQNKRYGGDYEVTLQDFRLPLKAFVDKNPDFDPKKLKKISFLFDQQPEGMVVIDRIGFSGV